MNDTTENSLKKDFRTFLWMVWHHLSLPNPTPIQYDIARYIQHGPRRCVVEAFRGVGKSWITSAFVVWLLYCDPQVKIMVVSASKERADAFSTFTKRLINEIELLHFLRPRGAQRDSNIAFDVGPAKADHSPSVKSIGITGQLTGSRADVIIADDVEIPSNSATETQRQKLSELVKEFDAVLKPGGRVIYLGTPQCEMSLYNQLESRGYQVRVWPGRYPSLDTVDRVYGNRLSPFIYNKLQDDPSIEGKPTEPTRFGELELIEREASYGRAGFALQFMLDTRLSDAERYPLKLNDLVVMGLNPEMAPMKIVWASSPDLVIQDIPTVGFNGDKYYYPMWVDKDNMAPYSGAVMFIDPAGRGADETAYAVVKILNGTLYLTAAGGLGGGYNESTLTTLATVAAQQKVTLVLNEANFGDGMFTKLFEPVLLRHHKCAVEEVRHTKQKELRIIDTLEPVMMQHRLVVDERVIRQDFETAQDIKKSLFFQLTRITRDRGALAHDDRIDALAGAVAYWIEQMNRDAEKGLLAHQERLKDQQLKEFIRRVKKNRRGTQEERTWVTLH